MLSSLPKLSRRTLDKNADDCTGQALSQRRTRNITAKFADVDQVLNLNGHWNVEHIKCYYTVNYCRPFPFIFNYTISKYSLYVKGAFEGLASGSLARDLAARAATSQLNLPISGDVPHMLP